VRIDSLGRKLKRWERRIKSARREPHLGLFSGAKLQPEVGRKKKAGGTKKIAWMALDKKQKEEKKL